MVQRTKQTDREMAKDYSEMDYGEYAHMYDPQHKCDHAWIDWSYDFHIRSKKCTQCEWVTDYKPNEPWLKTVKQA